MKLLCNIWLRNRLRNLFEGVSRPFSLLISNMLLISSENCYISLFQDGFLITDYLSPHVLSGFGQNARLARAQLVCPDPDNPIFQTSAKC